MESARNNPYLGTRGEQVYIPGDNPWEGPFHMLLFALFVGIPILEIALFIQVGGWLGLWPTLGIVILTALVGTTLLRTQGLQTLGQLQSSVSKGQNPMDPIAHGAFILIAGVLLLTPGFFTDALGLSFLIPPVRKYLIKAGASKMASRSFVFVNGQNVQQPRPASEDIVEGDYEVAEEDVETGPPSKSGWSKNIE